MVDQPNIRLLVYTKNGGSPGTEIIVLKTIIGGSPKNLVEFYTPSGGLPKTFCKGLQKIR